MTTAVTNADRFRLLAGYHHDIFSAIQTKQFQRAMRLLFAFAEDCCLGFESDVAALNETYQEVIDPPEGKEEVDPLPFLQEFHGLWIAMEDHVLAGLPAEAVQASTPATTAGEARSGDARSSADPPVDVKRAVLLRDSASRRPLIALKDATLSFGPSNGAFKLGPVTLQVAQNQIVGIVGPNGSGKTTLLRLIAGDLMQSSGEIDFSGLVDGGSTDDFVHAHRFWPAVRSKIAYVPPSPAPISQNTELTLWMTGAAHGISSAELEHQISVVMNKYELNRYSKKLVPQLSTGFRLRFELARILFTEPSVLVLDEPLANLDRNAQLTVLENLKMLSASVENPRSIVVSSQDIEKIASISDYLVFLADGVVAFAGTPEQVKDALQNAIFEITVESRIDDLETLLQKLGAIETQRTAISVLVLFPKGTDGARLQRSLLEAGLAPTSYRNLSNSVEALLLMPRFRVFRHSSAHPAVPVEKIP
jgi:ABC-2 type transport system ATP-binding protein